MEETVQQNIEDDVSDEDFDALPPAHNSDEELEMENASILVHPSSDEEMETENASILVRPSSSTSQQQTISLDSDQQQHARQQLPSNPSATVLALPKPMPDAEKGKLSAVIDLTHDLLKCHTKKKLGVVSTENFGVNLARWYRLITENKVGIDMLMNFLASETSTLREAMKEFDAMRKKPIKRMFQIYLLNSQSLRSVIEQALRGQNRSRCFTKFLFMNNFYIIIARMYKIYCFNIHVSSAEVVFAFEAKRDTATTNRFKMLLENARVITYLLKPSAYTITVTTNSEDKLKYLELVNRSSGKIDFYSSSSCATVVKFLKDSWSRIVELNIDAGLLKNSRAMPPKHFDKLEFRGIVSTGRLHRIFLHTADKLVLGIDYEFGENAIEDEEGESDDDSFESDGTSEVYSNSPKVIKECEISFFEFIDGFNPPLAIETVINSDLHIKKLIVQSNYEYTNAEEWEPETTDFYIVEYVQAFNQAIAVLQQASCDVIILDVRFKFDSEANHYKLPMNWLVGLKRNEGLEEINDVTSIDCHVITDLWMGRNVGNVFANFHGQLKYFYMDPEDVDNDD